MDRHQNSAASPPNQYWAGKRVALTGRLSSLTRREARGLILQGGGEVSSGVTRTTDCLVVGTVRWPLNRKGRLTRKLQRAQIFTQRGSTIEILDETAFLARSGLTPFDDHQRKLYSLGDLEQVLGMSRERLRGMLRAGWFDASEWRQGIPLFRFEEVRRLKSFLRLLDSGVTPQRVRRSLLRLRQLLPGASETIESLQWVDRWGRELVVRLPDGSLSEWTGQRLFDFAALDEPPHPTLPLPRDWYAEAIALEQRGDLAGTIACYEQLLLRDGPDADVCFQLANALYAVGRREAAAERFRQTVELESDFADAWNNLGNVLGELGRCDEAVEAYRCAVSLEPDWADARFGLADLLEESGRSAEAAEHWRRLLDPTVDPEYARYAQSRLARSI